MPYAWKRPARLFFFWSDCAVGKSAGRQVGKYPDRVSYLDLFPVGCVACCSCSSCCGGDDILHVDLIGSDSLEARKSKSSQSRLKSG